MTPWTIRRLTVPESLTAPDGWLLRGAVEVEHESHRDTWGTLDLARTEHEVLTILRHQRYVRRERFVAVSGPTSDGTPDPARVLGTAALALTVDNNTHAGNLEVAVRPSARRQGIGAALHDTAVAAARAARRTTLTTSTDQRSEPSPGPATLAPSTGSGLVRTDDDGVRFALARGFELEQVTRYSVLDVPLDPSFLAGQRASAQAAAGDAYRIVTWDDPCPDEWVDQLAELETRMSTDAPGGGLDLHEDRWDAARVRATEAELRERGMRHSVAAAVHVPTGTLVAFSAFKRPAWTDEFVHQHDTIVLAEHRGRRLGMLVKTANLERLAAEQPDARRIGTWNAEENAHMLGINVALGFRPAGGSGEWQARIG
ncbi:MAG TPA: GNAT family N-acetyltransferase [Cellulomonas sp.]|uniref:GNAT family N-acetyltransferase n=1 Tax=Cellulomonas sp. TaxID=40001 RepID=UPI002E31FDB2|nr:GNAT family N-acetyltransferase [Cellulomonas sp.]HEX5333481.1 GNAT family N-acetyltransferase [Cellulomonas sp.]